MCREKFKEMVATSKAAIEDFNDMADDRAIVWAADEIKRLSMPKGLLIVDHNGKDKAADYGVSFNGCNPELTDYVRCATEEDALRLIEILNRA